MPEKFSYSVPNDPFWLQRLLSWADARYSYFGYFRNHQTPYPHGGFEHRFFAGKIAFDLAEANGFYGQKGMVGIIAYDYKNQVERLKSRNPDFLDCPESLFFIPELEIKIGDQQITVLHSQADQLFEEILNFPYINSQNAAVPVKALTDHQTYLTNIRTIQDHIREGDIYELNYCMGFTFESKNWSPLTAFWELVQLSLMPFSAFFKAEKKYVICGSPERFLKKKANDFIAQPIKGTLKRGRSPEEDMLHRDMLLNSEKERAENLMIVDLMRNDLSKISKVGSVSVEELFGVYSFPRVWQMISTVRSIAKTNLSLKDLIHASFPMGSMTGAPKIKCMELIEQYENFRRGWFSGTLGYIEANGDLDLNVIIRSIVFDKGSGKGFFAVGSAITHDADAEYEYRECYLKAAAILEILNKT